MSAMQVGLIGYLVAYSLSPPMQQAAFDALGIAARYNLWETPRGALAERIGSLRAPGMLGANVTIPYKEDVVPLIDECDPLAACIGAVNTIVNRAGRLVGYNTDAPGFLRALNEGMASMVSGAGNKDGQHSRLYAKRVVLLGTGGAARAAAIALLESGIGALLLLGRSAEKVMALLNHLRKLEATMDTPPAINGALLKGTSKEQGQPSVLYNGILSGGDETARFLSSADVLVNATSVGLKADDTGNAGSTDTARLLIDVNTLPATSLVMDMIFNPPQTALLQAAREHGCSTLNGLSMLLYQGALSFELWTGCPAPLEVMRNALGL